MHFHQWSKWRDVDVVEKAEFIPIIVPIMTLTYVIKQQKRCRVCNLVKTRTS